MQFGIFKCAMLGMKRHKVLQSEGTELPNGELIKLLENEKGYKSQGMLQVDSVKSKEMKDTMSSKYYKRIRKILKASLNAGNTVTTINARTLSIIKYGARIVEWKKIN